MRILIYRLVLLAFGSLRTYAGEGNPPAQPCIDFDSPSITARDIAAFIPAFGGLEAGLRLGLAPEPGLRRVFSASELNRLLHRHWPAREAAERAEVGLCLQRRSRGITTAETMVAMQREFAGRAVRIEILELSRVPVAMTGDLRFSVHELPLASDPSVAVTWNGWFADSTGRKRAVWARVKLRERVHRIVSEKDIAAGEIVNEEHTAIEEREEYPAVGTKPREASLLRNSRKTGSASSVPELAADRKADPFAPYGKAARRPILSGNPILPEALEQVPAIRRGDTVILEVLSSRTRLTVEGKAESNAFPGHKVGISTALSKRVVIAIAQEKGRATLFTEGASRP